MSEPTIREIEPGEDAVAYPAIVALRTNAGDVDQFVTAVKSQRERGYRLVGVFEEGSTDAAAVVGFSTGQKFAWGSYLYIEDTSTHPDFQRRGHAGRLFNWVLEEARRIGVGSIHLDSGVQRHAAHSLYMRQGFKINAHHFVLELD